MEAFGWRRCPDSLEDLHRYWLDLRGVNNYNIYLLSFATLAWTLWKTRNKMAVERILPKQPSEVVFQFMSCLQRWRVIVRKEDRQGLDEVLSTLEGWLRRFCVLDDRLVC